MKKPILSVQNISAGYGKIIALKRVTIEVGNGETVSLIGPNGAGKTTLLKCIIGLHAPIAGKIDYLGQDITAAQTHKRVRDGIVLVPEGRGILPEMSVYENLLMGAYTRHGKVIESDIKDTFTKFPILKSRQNQMAGTLSGGEQQMLAIARAIISKPKLLMLDEPSLGLAPLIVDNVFEIVRELKGSGITILLVEQNARKALEIADKGYLLETGEIALSGSKEQLNSNSMIQSVYLGQ